MLRERVRINKIYDLYYFLCGFGVSGIFYIFSIYSEVSGRNCEQWRENYHLQVNLGFWRSHFGGSFEAISSTITPTELRVYRTRTNPIRFEIIRNVRSRPTSAKLLTTVLSKPNDIF